MAVSGDCEIVSISAFERLPPKTGLVVGITYILVSRVAVSAQSCYERSVYVHVV